MTHLTPRYCAHWSDDRDYIHLEGELDFPVDLAAEDVLESLRDRAEAIGAIVTHDSGDEFFRAYPWNGPGHFRCHFDSLDEPVTRITVHDTDGDEVSSHDIDDLEEEGQKAAELMAAVNEAGLSS